MLGRGLEGWQRYFEFMREEEKDGQTYLPGSLLCEHGYESGKDCDTCYSVYKEINRPKFEREERYIVLKKTDLDNFDLSNRLLRNLEEVCDTVNYFRGLKGPLECVVVEKDWPEYEIVWKLIEDRVNGNSRGAATREGD